LPVGELRPAAVARLRRRGRAGRRGRRDPFPRGVPRPPSRPRRPFSPAAVSPPGSSSALDLLLAAFLEVVTEAAHREVCRETATPAVSTCWVWSPEKYLGDHEQRDEPMTVDATSSRPTLASGRSMNSIQRISRSSSNIEVEEDHKQEDPAERRDGRMRGVEFVPVFAGVVQREVENLPRGQVRGQRDDRDREHQPHAEDRDENADRQKDALPEFIHSGPAPWR